MRVSRPVDAKFALLSCVLVAASIPASAQFQVIGPAPISPALARQQIRTLLEKVDPDNSQRTIKTLSGLTPWYRDILDQELIAAWRKDDRANLALVIEPLADPGVAAGVIEFSWREQRPAVFTPAYAPMLGRLMERYPDSAKPFLEDLLISTAPGQHPLALSPPEVEAVCRILLDLRDVRSWKKIGLQILLHYRQDAKNLLDKDMLGDDDDRRERGSRWLSDFALVDAASGAHRAAAPPTESKPTLVTHAEPGYSEIARKLRVQDTVVLQVLISPDGTPQTIKIVKPVGYGLDEKAMEAARQWRFTPGMRDGKAVPALANIQVNFRLGNIGKGITWTTGPMVFASAPDVTSPVVEDGAMPKPGSEASDESVVLEFTVDSSGAVNHIHAIHGSDSASTLLTENLAAWKFRPARNGSEPVEATGRIRFVKGEGDEESKLALTPPLPPGVGDDISEPTLLHRVDAVYSDAARAAGIKGVVSLRIVVDAEGNVVDPTVITSLGAGLDEKAIEAVRQWKFTPAYQAGKPVAVTKTVEINFALQ